MLICLTSFINFYTFCIISDLLDSKSDGIEVSYNAAGILSHIASDGEEAWSRHSISSVKRRDVLTKMVIAMEKWELDTKRNINYRCGFYLLRKLKNLFSHLQIQM